VAAWITFGVTHVPSPEQFPVMNVEHCRLMMKPVGFFDQNPGESEKAGFSS
jgi:primary-amine oxidase